LIFSFNFPFNLAAEPPRGEAETLTYPKRWTILKLARTIFAPRFARGDGEGQKIWHFAAFFENYQRTGKISARTTFL